MDDEAVAERAEFAVGAGYGFGCGTLEKGSCLRIDGRPEEVVGRGVADVELEDGIEFDELDEIGGAEVPSLVRWLGLEGGLAELFHGMQRYDAEAYLLGWRWVRQREQGGGDAECLLDRHKITFTQTVNGDGLR